MPAALRTEAAPCQAPMSIPQAAVSTLTALAAQ